MRSNGRMRSGLAALCAASLVGCSSLYKLNHITTKDQTERNGPRLRTRKPRLARSRESDHASGDAPMQGARVRRGIARVRAAQRPEEAAR